MTGSTDNTTRIPATLPCQPAALIQRPLDPHGKSQASAELDGVGGGWTVSPLSVTVSSIPAQPPTALLWLYQSDIKLTVTRLHIPPDWVDHLHLLWVKSVAGQLVSSTLMSHQITPNLCKAFLFWNENLYLWVFAQWSSNWCHLKVLLLPCLRIATGWCSSASIISSWMFGRCTNSKDSHLETRSTPQSL